MPTQPSKRLEAVPNPHPDRDYEIALEIPEFTCLCPMTGQPDFATFRVRYVPDQQCSSSSRSSSTCGRTGTRAPSTRT